MFSRITLAALMFAAATPLFAFFGTPAGYTLHEYGQSSGVSGIAWDTAGSDFYAEHNGGIRRFDTGANSFSSTLFFPTPVGKYFDHMAIDPTSTNDFYVSYSSGTNSEITRITRTGPDAGSVVLSFDYASPAHFIYRMAFVPDVAGVPAALRGQLLIASVDPTFAAGIYLVDKTTLALTKLIDVGTYNGNGPIAFDSQGNVYTAVPPTFGSFSPAIMRRFEAAEVAAAISGSPVPSSQGTDVISGADGVWNISAMSGRTEGGQDYIYYSTSEHASVFRLNVATGESRLFMQGFGGVSDGYTHFAQGGSIAFSGSADDFQPGSGGSVRLAVPFTVYTPGYGFYASVFLVDPAGNSANVAQLVVSQQPTTINSGVPFTIEVDALDSGGSSPNTKVGVIAGLATGAGSLDGFTIIAGPDGELNFTGLAYSTGTLPETITITIELTDNPGIAVTTANITVVAPATRLGVTAQPGSVDVSSFFGVTVQIQDGSATLVSLGPDAAREVTASLISGPGNLWGQTTVTAGGGVATFSALIVDTAGTYVIQFSSPGLTPVNVNLTVRPASDEGDDNESSGGCAAGSSGGWPALLGLLALLGVAARLRRARA
jgi:hypothetical protein